MNSENSGIIRRRENEGGVFSLVKDAKALLSKLEKISDKVEKISDNVASNGIRVKVVKLWPLTFDLIVKDRKN